MAADFVDETADDEGESEVTAAPIEPYQLDDIITDGCLIIPWADPIQRHSQIPTNAILTGHLVISRAEFTASIRVVAI
jgi:hypothetical protein